MGLVSNIKADAQGNRTKIQSSDAAALEQIFNKMFYLDKNPEKETAFVEHVMTRGLETAERTGLHASALIVSDGKFCLRQQVLSLIYKQLQGEQINVGLKRVFAEGDSVHEKWQRLFLRAGYSDVLDLDSTCFNKKWRVSYTPDIKCTIPQFFEGRMIGELKSMNTFQFKKITKHPSAGKQCLWYMCLSIAEEKLQGTWNGIDYTKGFVMTEDKNDQNFLVEVIDYDPKLVEVYVGRCEQTKIAYRKVFKERVMPGRPSDATKQDCKRCYTCPMNVACWEKGKAERIGE
jgi:hypothetical protein